MTKVLINNQIVDFDGAVSLMDDETREMVHNSFDGETEQEFADAYATAHEAKFGEVFSVN